ncbi:MAG: DUF433 domain-containing protein [Acidobacteria bacterium]|nr:DUF433 domain-containing protein [Acidobacteriota bacterium]
MNWEDRIVSDPKVLLGKPTIKGTRLSVAFILERLADGWTEKMLYDNYPRLSPSDLQAIFAYASDQMKKDFAFKKKNHH